MYSSSRLLLSLVLFLGILSSCHAFSGDGNREYRLGLAYLYFNPSGRGAAAALKGSQRSRASAMSSIERLEQALEHLARALDSAPSPSERSRLKKAMVLGYNRLSLEYDRRGKPDEAVRAAEKAVDMDGSSPVLLANLAAFQRRAGRTYEAGRSYEKAYRLAEGQDRRRLRSALIDFLMKRTLTEDKDDLKRAIDLIDEGLEEDPDDAVLIYRKASAYFQLGDFDRCLDCFQRLDRLGKLGANARRMYDEARKRRKALSERARFVIERAGFVITFDEDIDRSAAARISDFLVSARDELSPVFGVHGRTLINVYVHRVSEFRQIHGNRPIAGTSMLNRIDLLIRDGLSFDRLQDTVFHEFTHYLVTAARKNNQADVPVWFNEGLAQHFEPNRNWRRTITRGIKLYKSKRRLTIGELENIKSLSNSDFHRAYVQSFFQVHWLVEHHGQEPVVSIVTRMAAGVSFDDAFKSVVGETQQEFFRSWRPRFRRMLIRLRKRYLPDLTRPANGHGEAGRKAETGNGS